jgi:hypothetical protein
MKQIQQEQQLDQVSCDLGIRDKQKKTINIHNPNTKEETAKYLAKLILQGLEEKAFGDEL